MTESGECGGDRGKPPLRRRGDARTQIEEYAPGASGLLNQRDGNYQFNWKTPQTYAKSCKTMKLDLGEGPGMERIALFQFTK